MPEFPSARRLLREHLAGLLDVPVVTRVPAERPPGFVRILNAGGAGRLGPVLEEVALTVESWDDSEVVAEDRANHIRGLLCEAPEWAGRPVYRYRESGPPVDLPDESEQHRFTFTLTIRLRGT
ncbi:hypothetical protein NQ036_03640 [Brevibacterium sp. 91QC2O2]|uniref:hypothetical protein n=1 Tax=Brevibacterium TaxID=1696 RepID=UPI00211BA6B9|nr:MULTISPECIES: hypothetical protein [unclassified Brevibacterium]MCQ9367339.1 hypothetical protein [Brevibacterium sp. 91QC2O2]MCQ9384648.1 hypothetical protein [Brevibacterium sp. 68QC2CO]